MHGIFIDKQKGTFRFPTLRMVKECHTKLGFAVLQLTGNPSQSMSCAPDPALGDPEKISSHPIIHIY